MRRSIKVVLVVLLASTCHGFFHFHGGGRRPITRQSSSSGHHPIHATDLQPGDFTRLLKDYLQRNDTSLITVDCYVISRRKLGKQLAFVDFQTKNDGDIVQALLRKEIFRDNDHYDGMRACLLKGTKVRVTGIASGTRIPGNTVLLLHSIELMAFPRQIQHIQIILQQALDRTIRYNHIECIEYPKSLDVHLKSKEEWNKNEVKQLAKEIFDSLPNDPLYPRAADQQVLSKQKGNFVKPQAPNYWLSAPMFATSLGSYEDDDSTRNVQDTIQFATNSSLNNATTNISLVGWVQNRRRFDQNISMIALVDELTVLAQDSDAPTHKNRLCCILHPDMMTTEAEAEIYQNLLAVGAKVWVEGILVSKEISRSGRPEVWVQELRLLQSSSRSVTIRYLLDLLHDNVLDAEQVAEALSLPLEQVKALALLGKTERQWKANSIAADLQQRSKLRRVRPDKLEILQQYKPIALKHPVLSDSLSSSRKEEPSRKSKTIIPLGMPGTKWASKKRPQLEWMGNQVRKVLQSHPEYGSRKLAILDIGGGKGALANYLGQEFVDQVEVHVIDISEGAVANGAKKAERLNLPVSFKAVDATDSEVVDEIPVDIVVALHACGHLSDVALAHAVKHNAGFVVVPCCFNSNPHLKVSETTPNPPGSSESAALEMEVQDWLDIPREDWTALKLLAEVQGDIPLASQAIATVCAVRSDAVSRRLIDKPFEVEIRSFPIQYSTRNIVIVGSFA